MEEDAIGEDTILEVLSEFWSTYYSSIRQGHLDSGQTFSEPVYGRNNHTTNSKHVKLIEDYSCRMLAKCLGVPRSDVGPRQVRVSEHRKKNFDCVWPLTGEAKIAISVKSLQSAYRNLVNRYEEAFGDLAITRLGGSNIVFGFLMVVLDGPVARGKVGTLPKSHPLNTDGRAAPIPALVEEGGDWLESLIPEQPPAKGFPKRKDIIQSVIMNLSDMVFEEPEKLSGTSVFPKYDSIALIPTRFQRSGGDIMTPEGWIPRISSVPLEVGVDSFFIKLIETAKIRGFV